MSRVPLCSGVISWKECLNNNAAWDTLTWFAALIAMAAYLNKVSRPQKQLAWPGSRQTGMLAEGRALMQLPGILAPSLDLGIPLQAEVSCCSIHTVCASDCEAARGAFA